MGTSDPPTDPENEDPDDDRSLADVLHGKFSEVNVDPVEAVREIRERI